MKPLIQLMSEAIRASELNDEDVAAAMGVTPSYFCKLVRRRLMHAQGDRMVAFMRVTNSTAPLDWLAHQMDCVAIPRSEYEAMTARLRELEGVRA